MRALLTNCHRKGRRYLILGLCSFAAAGLVGSSLRQHQAGSGNVVNLSAQTLRGYVAAAGGGSGIEVGARAQEAGAEKGEKEEESEEEDAAEGRAVVTRINLDSLTHPLDDGGPGPLWVPPSERPIPLDAFPSLNGHTFQADGHLDEGQAAERGKASSSAEGGGARGAGGTGTTLLFMHLWKCAGSSLRHLLRDWAEAKNQDIGIVVRCPDVYSKNGKVCLQHHALIDPAVQGPYIRKMHILAGHFTWGFQDHVRQPYVMFTTLRNPLEMFVSGQQYLNRKESRHFPKAVSMVESTMKTAISAFELRSRVVVPGEKGNTKSVGFLARLIDPILPAENETETKTITLDMAAAEAKSHLDTFWLVGVIEQYEGFLAVLQAMMDPHHSEKQLWDDYAVGIYNQSPQGAEKVLGAIDPQLVQDFNATLRHQWDVYAHAMDLYKHRCLQILREDLRLCEVRPPPSLYTLSDQERHDLYQEVVPFRPSRVREGPSEMKAELSGDTTEDKG